MKVFFLGESNHPNAQTWLAGIKEFGHCEIETWEITAKQGSFARLYRMRDWLYACFFLRRKIKKSGADILLATRLPSYGFIGACTGFHPFVVAQQGITDIWPPNSATTPIRVFLAKQALKNADMIHAWGEAMVPSMLQKGADPKKIKVLPRGVDLRRFDFKMEDKNWDKIHAIVTRSLKADYNHDIIIKAAKILKDNNIPAEIVFIGDGVLMEPLQALSKDLGVGNIISFAGRIPNDKLHSFLTDANMYISVPVTEGVSASLFEAMGVGAFPIVTELPGTRPWINNGENGYMVPMYAPEALANAMIKAWNDKQFMKRAITFNRNIVEAKADYNKNMPAFVEWYRELVNKAS